MSTLLIATPHLLDCTTDVDVLLQSILAYNGAAVVAMKGKDCVAIAADRRFGIQAQTVAMDFQKIFEMGPRLYIGLPGLATDVQTVSVHTQWTSKSDSYFCMVCGCM